MRMNGTEPAGTLVSVTWPATDGSHDGMVTFTGALRIAAMPGAQPHAISLPIDCSSDGPAMTTRLIFPVSSGASSLRLSALGLTMGRQAVVTPSPPTSATQPAPAGGGGRVRFTVKGTAGTGWEGSPSVSVSSGATPRTVNIVSVNC